MNPWLSGSSTCIIPRPKVHGDYQSRVSKSQPTPNQCTYCPTNLAQKRKEKKLQDPSHDRLDSAEGARQIDYSWKEGQQRPKARVTPGSDTVLHSDLVASLGARSTRALLRHPDGHPGRCSRVRLDVVTPLLFLTGLAGQRLSESSSPNQSHPQYRFPRASQGGPPQWPCG